MANLLNAELNRYHGRWVTIDFSYDPSNFHGDLLHSLNVWHAEGIKVIWLTIPASYAVLIPIAIKHGFAFHHTRDDNLTLTKKLTENAIFPEFANHTVGVGCIVLNDQNEVLTVVEKYDMKDRQGHWKFPGGAVDNGELVRDAAIREVHEETGIESTFVNMIGMRHYHRGQFGTSNMYVICHLQALSNTITVCPDEIGMAKWFNIDDYLACDTVTNFNKTLLCATLEKDGLVDVDLGDLHGTPNYEYEVFC